MALRLLFLLLILSGCNPVIGATSFMNSLVTGNTVGTITGGASWGNNPYDDLGNID